jgi:hypothetical protein
MRKQFKDDPRTRILELLKRWLRQNAGSTAVDEEEMRGFCCLCRDILNHANLFPARNPRSFIRTIAEVHDHLNWQLREILEHDRTCADLSKRLLSLSRNLLSDAITYLLLAPTCLKQTDSLPSLEVVALWQSLPDEGHPLPSRVDQTQQKAMRDAWETQCGSLIAAVLRAPWCVRFFDGAGAEEEAREAAAAIVDQLGDGTQAGCAVRALVKKIKLEFERGDFKNSGLAGAFRAPARGMLRKLYLSVVEATFDLLYLLGEAFTQFQRISDCLGDYGSIRISAWLHPFLDSLTEKVQSFKNNLVQLNEAADDAYVLARARGRAVEKPAPSSQMGARAHSAVERAVLGRNSHVQSLLQTIDALKVRSAPERLPRVMEGLGDACLALQTVLTSSEFRARIGDSFPDLPPLCRIEAGPVQLQLADGGAPRTTFDSPFDDSPRGATAQPQRGGERRAPGSGGALAALPAPPAGSWSWEDTASGASSEPRSEESTTIPSLDLGASSHSGSSRSRSSSLTCSKPPATSSHKRTHSRPRSRALF